MSTVPPDEIRAEYDETARVAVLILPNQHRVRFENVDRNQVRKLLERYIERFGARGDEAEPGAGQRDGSLGRFHR